MKRVLLIFAATTMAASVSFAQEFRLGVTAGLELSNMLDKDNTMSYSAGYYESKPGLKLGVVGEIAFNDYFALVPEVAFAQRGYKETYEGVKWKETINYLQTPFNVKLSYPISDDFKIFAFAGPYAALALWGRIKADNEIFDMMFGADEEYDDYKRFDFGLNFGAGAEFKGFFLQAQYNLGLANISPYTGEGTKIANRNIGISLGYMFSF